MELRDFMDLSKLQQIQDRFSEATGLAVVAVDNYGEHLTEESNHAESTDFTVDILVNGAKVGAMVGGKTSREDAGQDEQRTKAAAELLENIVNQLVNLEYYRHGNTGKLKMLHQEVQKATEMIDMINDSTGHLKAIASKQRILSLNASIEAARSGEAGAGFAVVAKSMQDLSAQSSGIYNDIEESVAQITDTITDLSNLFEQENE